MPRVMVVTDSTAGLPQELVDQYQIRVLPQTLIMDNNTYKDGIDIQPSEFYARLETAEKLPTTSQASPGAFYSVFSEAAENGQDVLAVLISGKMSGTISSATQAREMLPASRIEVVDSKFSAMATGFIVLHAARTAETGASLEECTAAALQARQNAGVYFMVEDLKYLHMGGRIKGGARLLGTALDLKPILHVPDGQIEALARVRSSRKAIDRLVELTGEAMGGRQPVHISVMHARAPEGAKILLEKAVQQFHPQEIHLSELSPVVGSHTGPGTLVIAYLAGV